MPETRDTSVWNDIADEAARWFADHDSGLLADDTALRAWLEADPRRACAFVEMEITWSQLGKVGVPDDVRASLASPESTHVVTPVFQPRRWIPVALAASVTLVIVGSAGDWAMRLRADATTATGEQRVIALPDGSRVMRNTRSAIAFDYAPERRTERLLQGEAAFTVAPDRTRPFVVEANGGATTALGTRFIVRDDADLTRVSVTEHSVRVAYPAGRDQGSPSVKARASPMARQASRSRCSPGCS